jgi:dephospho-CoA kinase
MLKIGITGGIGSGKSVVAKVFETLGIPVYYADDAAKRLMNEDAVLKEKIQSQFGKESYTDGKLNRAYIASIVFANPDKLALLNSLVHPVTIEDANNWMQQQTTAYAIKEAALLFESSSNKELDKIIGVYAPVPLRILRVMKRDQMDREEVLARMNRQMNEEEKMRLCDYVITNDEQSMVLPQVLELHKKFLSEPGSIG